MQAGARLDDVAGDEAHGQRRAKAGKTEEDLAATLDVELADDGAEDHGDQDGDVEVVAAVPALGDGFGR